MSSNSELKSKLFEPVQIGDITLGHRIVLAPLTTLRANKAHAHGELAVEFYSQRASTPGTLLIAESTFIAAKAGGYDHMPGIWNAEQIDAWKKVVDAVHARRSFIYLQLVAIGRSAVVEMLEREGFKDSYVSSSAVASSPNTRPPRPLTISEISEYIQLYATAASDAVHKAGFDGVEVHCGNGTLLDQFLQDVCNHRTDEYGGSVENRCKFPLEVIKAVTDAVGEKKTSVRVSPWGTYGGMRMQDPRPTFSYFIALIRDLHPDFAYLHVIEPRVSGGETVEVVPQGDSNDFLRAIWSPKPIITAGGYTRDLAIEAAEKHDNCLVAFGRYFIANPDLPRRIMEEIPWTHYDRSTFYVPEDPHGYIDYPFASV